MSTSVPDKRCCEASKAQTVQRRESKIPRMVALGDTDTRHKPVMFGGTNTRHRTVLMSNCATLTMRRWQRGSCQTESSQGEQPAKITERQGTR